MTVHVIALHFLVCRVRMARSYKEAYSNIMYEDRRPIQALLVK